MQNFPPFHAYCDKIFPEYGNQPCSPAYKKKPWLCHMLLSALECVARWNALQLAQNHYLVLYYKLFINAPEWKKKQLG